jgi:hypothetical protein
MTAGFTLATRSAKLAGCSLVKSAARAADSDAGRLNGAYPPGPAKSKTPPRAAPEARRIARRARVIFCCLRLFVSVPFVFAMTGSPFPKIECRAAAPHFKNYAAALLKPVGAINWRK